MGHTNNVSHIAIALGFGALLLASGSAAAADGTPAIAWSGPYVGLLTGMSDQQTDWTTKSIGPDNVFGVDPTSAKESLSQMGGRLGIYGGWTFPINANLVAGVEGDFAGVLGGKKTLTGVPGGYYSILPTVGTPDDSISAQQNWDAGLRARLGYAVDPAFLVYGTGGIAFQDADYKINCPGTAASICSGEAGSISKTSVGWTLGAGAEGKLTDALALRVEYRYASFGSENLNFFQSVNQGVDSISAKVDPSSHIITFGLTYRFGGI